MELAQPNFVMLIRQFLHEQLHLDLEDSEARLLISADSTLNTLPDFHDSEKISVTTLHRLHFMPLVT
jgi:hypothetical protein